MMSLAERDVALIWHPCSQMKDYEELPPIAIDHAKGVRLYDVEGNSYIDIISSWWANLLGHCNEKINAAIKQQVDSLEHVIFANFTHRPVVELAERLMEITPERISKFHFNDNGSAAVECALKMCFQYYYQTGKTSKQRFMCLSEGYHGETIGALAVGSMDLYAKMYRPMMMETIHVEAPDCYRCPYGAHRDNCDCACFVRAEEAFEKHAHETAGMIVEPLLQGSAGMRIYPPLYLQKLRRLCDDYDVQLIFDEIATGFGRTGKMFAADVAGVSPDVMTLSKGLTGGYLPMSVTCVSNEIYDAFYDDYSAGKAFLHSHTYAGNPIGCAAALAVQEILRDGSVFEKARDNAAWLTCKLQETFKDHPHLGEIRHIGLVHALEFVQDPHTKEPFDARHRTGYAIYKKALSRGLLLRPLGDTIYFNPPLSITREELAEAVSISRAAVYDVLS